MSSQAQRDALLDYRHGMYRHEASGASTKASRPPSRSSAEIAASAGAQPRIAVHDPSLQNTLTTHPSVQALLNSQLQAPEATSFPNTSQPFQYTAASDNPFGPGNNDFDGLFQQLLSQDLTDFSMPLFWQHQQ